MKPWSEMTTEEHDAVVAEKVMEWQPYMLADDEVMDGYFYNGLTSWPVAPPSFTTDMSTAWTVVEHMRKKEYHLVLESFPSGFRADFHGSNAPVMAYGAPEAICLSALRALGVKVGVWER